MKTHIISFATPGYSHELASLQGDCEKLGIPHDLRYFASNARSWSSANYAKLPYMKEMMEKHECVAWLDSDCRIRQVPVLFEELEDMDVDMCFYMPPNRHLASVSKHDPNSCVMWMRHTPATLAFIDNWASRRTLTPELDRSLFFTIQKMHSTIRWHRLPQCYVKMNWIGWQPGENRDIVIEDLSCVNRDRRKRRRWRAKRMA